MKYSEFKERIEVWGQKHGYVTEVRIRKVWTHIKIGSNEEFRSVASISNRYPFMLDTNWEQFNEIKESTKVELFDIIVEFARTPIEERKGRKRFIIPLPGLVTTDGRQQYLSYKDGYYFTSRRNEDLRQIWEEEHLKQIPKFYRQFAVEFGKGKELEDDYKK